MDITATPDDVAHLIATALRVGWAEEDEEYHFDVSLQRDLFEGEEEVEQMRVTVSREHIEHVLQRLRESNVQDETTLVTARTFEVMVQEQSPRYGPRRFMREGPFIREDEVSGITYQIGQPSDEYILFLLLSFGDESAVRAAWRFGRPFRRRNAMVYETVFDALRDSLPMYLTVHLLSDKDRSYTELSRYSDALLFQLSYNMDISIVQQRFLDDIVRTGRLARLRRSRIEEVDPPRRHYIPDLVHHYQMGVANDSPPLEFLSYYHVAEHFFESIFSDDLVNRVQSIITGAGFSYRRARDIRSLVNEVKGRLRFQNESVTFSEEEALRLTLVRYVNVEDLRDALYGYDSSLIEYYKTMEVSFSKGIRVNLDESEDGTVFTHLARRIYRTRNSIVHSKEGERNKYIPFKHDRELNKEIPLIRFISEMIIEGASTMT